MLKDLNPLKQKNYVVLLLNIKSKNNKTATPVTAIPVIKTFLFSKKVVFGKGKGFIGGIIGIGPGVGPGPGVWWSWRYKFCKIAFYIICVIFNNNIIVLIYIIISLDTFLWDSVFHRKVYLKFSIYRC